MSQLFLCPQVRYELKDGDKLTFADVQCVYVKSPAKQQVIQLQFTRHSLTYLNIFYLH